jgi:hypothetical protein
MSSRVRLMSRDSANEQPYESSLVKYEWSAMLHERSRKRHCNEAETDGEPSSTKMIRSCPGSIAKSLASILRSSLWMRRPSWAVDGSHDARKCKPPLALTNTPPTSSYAWHKPCIWITDRFFQFKMLQAFLRSLSFAKRSAWDKVEKPESTMPSRPSSMIYCSSEESSIMVFRCLQT